MSSLPGSPFDVGKASRIAALALLPYDFLITFDAEVNFVWRQRKCTWSFWLYIFNKFFPIAWIFFASIALNSGTVLTKSFFKCGYSIQRISILHALNIIHHQVYALYELSKRLRYLLLIGCTAELVTMLALTLSSVIHVSHLHWNWISTPTGCYYSGGIGITMSWIPALVFEPVLCALVAWKAWGAAAARWIRLRKARVCEVAGESLDLDEVPPLVTLMARDSLVYFFGIYFVLVALTIATAARWTYALPSILGSRVVLHVRELMLAENAPSLPSMGGAEILEFAPASVAVARQDDRNVYLSPSSRADEERGFAAL
ncbi:hypothetical protein FA95DRAFT_1612647 [Auriscalpium vulgare]|uniref:Uncharacterized protein n=1 Tax=Auriscalpium vulgare TaxID=40419 RepID=A0ACB8R5F1_9AGAM|nr:hypothetical protein FA95DRAFT_1612647 [Auriscalpium vulgare]